MMYSLGFKSQRRLKMIFKNLSSLKIR